MRVVVSHYAPYAAPLRVLVASLVASRVALREVVVFGTGYVNATVGFVDVRPHGRVFSITQSASNWEYTSFDMLHQYRRHPRVQSDSYIMIHDTTVAHPGFPGVNFSSPEMRPYDVVRTHGTTANIFAFRHSVLNDIPARIPVMNKSRGVVYEMSGSIFGGFNESRIFYAPERTCTYKMKMLATERVYRWVRGLRVPARADVYGTGHPRDECYYDIFHLSKYLSFDHMGDIDGTYGRIVH